MSFVHRENRLTLCLFAFTEGGKSFTVGDIKSAEKFIYEKILKHEVTCVT